MNFEAKVNDQPFELDLDLENGIATVGDRDLSFEFTTQENGRRLLRIGEKLYKIDNVHFDKHDVEFTLNGRWCRVPVRNEQELLLDRLGFKSAAEVGEGQLNAPMPGKILEIVVNVGDTVNTGDPVAILEAMKMENELKAPVDGTISSIHVEEGQSVEKNVLILEIEASG